MQTRWWIRLFSLATLLMTGARDTLGQSTSLPALPSPVQPPGASPTSVQELAERLQKMEEMNKKLADQLERSTREHDEQMRTVLGRCADLERRLSNRASGEMREASTPVREFPPLQSDDESDLGSPVPEYWSFQREPSYSDPHYRLSNINVPPKRRLRGWFGPGFQLQTDDEEFRLQVHVLSQIEARAWDNGGQTPPVGGFYFPRQRIFFNGRITKPVEYVFSINRGLNSIDLLDAFLNFNFDDRFQVRFGRYMTPLTYEQFAIRPMWLPTPERSLFTTNLGLNRQLGLMAWGYLFDKRLDYAAGLFNGSRNSFQTLSNANDFIGYLNARPFQDSEALWFLKYLNVGSSVAIGYQEQQPVPASLRIGAVSPDAALPPVASMPFLVLNPNVIERGDRLLGSVHAAYYFKGLSVLGEWQYGYAGYATAGRPSVSVPISAYYATAAYFLTGEHIENRSMIQPRRPLIPTQKGQIRGLGAWEAVARVSELQVGQNIFTAGFADPSLWSNSALTTELGVNWYWNEHTKIYMFWLHGDFADPILVRPGAFQRSSDMFWLRCQLWF